MRKFTKNLLFLQNGEQVIVGNKCECTFLKMSSECYDILNGFVNKGIGKHEYENIFEDKDDKEYFSELHDKLVEKKILVDENDKELLTDFDIQWEVTNQCNLHCKHCIADAVTTKTLIADRDEIYAIADKIIGVKPRLITVTGGEPMVLPFFFELSEYLRKNTDGEMNLMTNGTYINEENAVKIKELYDAVFISVDGSDEKSCSEIRGAGVFGKVMNAIKCLKAAGVKNISLSFVLTAQNREHEKPFLKLCKDLEVSPMVRTFSPVGRGKDHKDWYIQDESVEDNDPVAPEIVKKARENQPYIEFGACGGRYGSFTVNPKGNMFLCAPYECSEKPIGNILDVDDIRKYFYEEEFRNTDSYLNFEKKMPENFKRCKECSVKYFCWHCPFLFEQSLKNEKSFDNYCKLRKKEIGFSLWGEI